MNKNILIGIGGVILAGIGFGIYKTLNKKEDKAEEVKENAKETSTEEYVEELFKEEKDLEEYEKKENKKSINDQDVFEDKVTDSKEFETLNEIRKAAGKEPVKMNENLEKFLGEDSKNKSVKESLDNIAENIKNDPKLKKKILNILKE